MFGRMMLHRLTLVMMTVWIDRYGIVVQAQPHKNHRTCALHENEIVYLYYNSTMGIYVRYNNETDRRLSSYDGDDLVHHNTRDQQNERIRINNDNIIYPQIGRDGNKSNDSNDSPNSNTIQLQQQRSQWHNYFISPSVRLIQNDEERRPEPAIAMVFAEHGRHLSTTSITTSQGSNRNRGDDDQIRNIDPNIELYQSYDGRIISVRSCHCSDQNTYNNNIKIDNVTSNYTYYCPLSKNYCYVPIRATETPLSTYETYPYYYHPVCIPAKEASTYFVRNLKLIGCGALALVTILLLVSPTGHNAIRCCCSTFIPGCFHYNQRYVDYMIRNDSKLTKDYLEKFMKDNDREERFNQRYMELQRLHGEAVVRDHDEVPEECHDTTTTVLNELEESIVRDMYYYRPSLLLKTRRYCGPPPPLSPPLEAGSRGRVTSDRTDATSTLYDADTVMQPSTNNTQDGIVKTDSLSNHRRNEDGCMVCFNAIDIGSKVGILPNCEHTFHTTCLKEWLKRRNVCPLCLDTDVATVAFSLKNDPSRDET